MIEFMVFEITRTAIQRTELGGVRTAVRLIRKLCHPWEGTKTPEGGRNRLAGFAIVWKKAQWDVLTEPTAVRVGR